MKKTGLMFLMFVAASTTFAATKNVTLEVKGWTCEVCSTATRVALKKLDGVEEVRVDADKSEAVVTYDDGKTTPQRLIQRVEKQGYKAKVKPENGNKK